MIKKIKKIYFSSEDIYCPECDIILEKSDIMLMCNPPLYQYFCKKCDHRETSTVSYPNIIGEFQESESLKNALKIIEKNHEISENVSGKMEHDTFSEYGYDYEKGEIND